MQKWDRGRRNDRIGAMCQKSIKIEVLEREWNRRAAARSTCFPDLIAFAMPKILDQKFDGRLEETRDRIAHIK